MECQKHDHHNHGVCPSCLRERLSGLPATNNVSNCYVNGLSSPSPHSSSASAAGDTFPARTLAVSGGHHHHQRVGSMSFAVGKALKGNCNDNNLFDVGEGLKKSRSMAFGPRDCLVGETRSSGGFGKKKNKKKNTSAAAKKLGFWTKLLPFRGKAGGSDDGLVHVTQRLHC